MHAIRWSYNKLTFLVMFLVCGSLTVFILASSYETAFGKDLPYINAVNDVNLSLLRPQPDSPLKLNGITANQTKPEYEGTYGTPSDFKTSRSTVRIAIAPPLFADGQWLSRSSVAHYIITSPAKGANIGNMIIYMRGSQTTIAEPQSFEAGDNIFIDTKREWRYLYKIDEVISASKLSYVMSQATKPRLFLVVDSKEQPQVIVAATLLNVQSGNQ